ncbi:helix-turn-helix domain-containing protein [Kineococcus sp. SYSU DK005]|uniref:helix-turn-helix domain-containing protein n=1 Tax=Kineococcus sp. SYSU DK005 TaxID=3383126 RepID=UPI003D7CA88B
MSEAAGETNRLGEYLRARRALVTPQQAGLPAGARRRVPGLRREEVALLAGVSADYYLRLERGRDRNPSPQVLGALARVLHLDEVETQYLRDLAQPHLRSGPRARSSRRRAERVPARLHYLLAAVEVPAFVEGRAFDVLASNPLALAFSPRLRVGENRLRSLFLDPAERDFHRDWEAATAEFVGAFRHSIGVAGATATIDAAIGPVADGAQDASGAAHDARIVELVGELSLASGRFRALWDRHDVRRLQGGTTVVDHPVVGELRLHRDKLPVEGVLLVVYYPDTGSDSAEKLQLLASLAGTNPDEAPLQP